MTKLEEVARAMDPELWDTVPEYKPPRAIEISREISLNRARLAIEAMKGPTAEMIAAAQKNCVIGQDNLAPCVFNAMIDAALEGK